MRVTLARTNLLIWQLIDAFVTSAIRIYAERDRSKVITRVNQTLKTLLSIATYLKFLRYQVIYTNDCVVYSIIIKYLVKGVKNCY